MSTLVLDSLEIKNFRAFKHLRIEKLGRVNLIVGKNNVGKTSVLEALWIYAEQGEPALLYRILSERDEAAFGVFELEKVRVNVQERGLALNNLFFDRPDTRKQHNPIQVGSLSDGDKQVIIDVRWPLLDQSGNRLTEVKNDTYFVANRSPLLTLQLGFASQFGLSLDHNFVWGDRVVPIGYADYTKHCVVGAEGITSSLMSLYWDDVALSPLEQEVLNALRIIAPEVESLNFIGSGVSINKRSPKVRLSGFTNPTPLRSLGEGMNRMLGIALALVNAKDGMLLIDEVDTGLHYSVLPDMWKLIFEVAHRLNVQVFATSHSWDCIQAFQQAAADSKEAEGVLVRLEQRKHGIGAVTFDEQELAIVTREQIEVR